MSTLDNLRGEAKRWLKALRAMDAPARERLRRAHPSAPAIPGLRDVQHALAREHGFESWVAMKAAVTKRPAGALALYESLAQDLVRAHDDGNLLALRRLVDQFGGQVTIEQLREGIASRLAELPKEQVPPGPFGLDHARLVIARQAGFDTWSALVDLLSGPAGTSEHSTIPAYAPAIAPGMIIPVEVAAGLRVKLRDGSEVTTTQVWSMLTACRNGEAQRVRDLAAANAGLVLCDYNYMAPLHLAVREGHLHIVTYLAEHGAANPNYVTYPYRESLVTVARDRGYDEIARVLSEWYAREDPGRPEEEGGELVYERDEERVRFQKLVNLGARMEVEDLLRRRPELAVDPFAFWSEGILSIPANRGDRAMLELLMQYGARVPDVSKWGAWYYFKRDEIAEFLIGRGMNPNHMNVHHTTLLHDMAYTDDVRKAALLLDAGANIDAVDEEFRSTPLGLAARFDNRAVVELLLSCGADPNKAAAAWATPLEWARKKGHADIAERLRRAGAHDSRPQSRSADRRRRETDVHQRIATALDTHDADSLRQLMREHRDVFEQDRPHWLELEPDTIVARARPPRSLPVRPELERIEVEVDAAGGDDKARLDVARSYGAGSWERLVLACRLIDAIWRDEPETVREIVTAHSHLLHEDAGIRDSNCGPPMAYAANLGRNRIVRMLHEMGAKDLPWALDRAILQGQLDTARMLYELGARPSDAAAAMEGPAETLNAEGMALLLDLGVKLTPETAPTAMVLQTYGRNPDGKHRILELFARHGIALPDTPPMAVHRGRIDLLEEHLRRDPGLFSRTFAHEAVFPPELGCHADHSLALHGTPLDGAGLLHMCAEYDEIDLARWMIERGADVNLKARVDADGFGGHTPLFNAVVSLFGGRPRRSDFAQLLLDHGADPHVRASLRKGLRFADDESVHEYRDVTPVQWGERFHDRSAVNEPALQSIAGASRART